MNILLVCGIFPPDIGGPAKYIPDLALELQARGHRVEVITLADDPRRPAEWSFPVVRVRRRLFFPLRQLKVIWLVARKAAKADIVLANTLGFEASLGAKLAGRPIVHKVVGDYAWERARSRGWYGGTIDDYQGAEHPLRLRLLNVWRTFPLRMADHVFTPSGYLKQIVLGWGVHPSKVEVIYNTYSPPDGAPPEIAPCRLAPPTVIVVGRLVTWKHVDEVIEAVLTCPGVRLVIVGDGPELARLSQLVSEANAEARVSFAGRCSASEVAKHLRRASIFIQNSTYEGLPHTVLEAMHFALPVIVTPAGGTTELVTDGVTGLVVPYRNPPAIAAALRRLLGDPARALALGEAGKRLVESRFSRKGMIEATEAMLRRFAQHE